MARGTKAPRSSKLSKLVMNYSSSQNIDNGRSACYYATVVVNSLLNMHKLRNARQGLRPGNHVFALFLAFTSVQRIAEFVRLYHSVPL